MSAFCDALKAGQTFEEALAAERAELAGETTSTGATSEDN